MTFRIPSVAAVALLALLALGGALIAPAAHASEGKGKNAAAATAGVPWEQLTPAQQQVLEPYRGRWNQLPPERQQMMLRGAERWQQMTPGQQD
ncbi:MAG: DUF3106 domain-containing protein, partial [Gammaproteobacteria bacterium]|nr:DUF3106 domain-containing protein [Gammaproteobacteria bacterium]